MQKRRQISIYERIHITVFSCCSICSDSLNVEMALRPASGSHTKAAMGGGQSFEKAAEKNRYSSPAIATPGVLPFTIQHYKIYLQHKYDKSHKSYNPFRFAF